MSMRSDLTFAAAKTMPERYRLVNVAAHLSHGMRHPYKDSIADSINAALSRIAGAEAPKPLPSPSWKKMLSRYIALRQMRQESPSLAGRKWKPLTDDDRKEIIALGASGLTQAQIAAAIGYSTATVSKVLAANDAAVEKVLAGSEQQAREEVA